MLQNFMRPPFIHTLNHQLIHACLSRIFGVWLSFKNSLTFLISITALPMKPSHLKKRRGRQVGVNGSKRKKKEREREGRESKRRKCLQGKLLKKVQAGWLGSSSKGWIPPLPPLHPNGSCWHHR